MNPLVRGLNLKQVEQRDRARAPTVVNIVTPENESALAGRVRQAWGRNKLAKMRIDIKLLDCLRARRGQYSPEALAQLQQGSTVNIVWYDLTETKCRAASAWIREIVLPAGERPWGIKPTALPDLPAPFKKSLIAKSIEQAQQVLLSIGGQGAGVMPKEEFKQTVQEITDKLRAEAEEAYKRAAERQAQRMERQIADRLDQGNWAVAMDQFVEDFVTYPAAILKGPTYQRHKRLSWGEGWTPKVTNDAAQTWESISPFDVYPAPGAANCQTGDFIERIRFWRKELHALKGVSGYRDDQIDGALRDYYDGHMEGWLWTESERQRLEQETLYNYVSPPGMIDALNFFGSVPGWMLQSWGVTSHDGKDLAEFEEYEVNVLVCGRYILYAAINADPLGQRPFRRACYDEIPGAFWGRSIPELCRTSQKFCNVAACSMADNLAFASGPMAWVHVDRLADGEQSLDIIPLKVWQLKDAGMGSGTNPGIGFFQADDRSGPLMKVLESWELKADDASGIPRYVYGNEQVGGAAGTATGLSMLLNNAAKGLRRAIGNIDINVISPTIGDCFTNEMLFNPDDSIKGDCIVVARGAAAILIKDMAQQRRTQFMAQTANPIDMQIIGTRGRATLLRETAQALDLPVDDIVPSDEELIKREEQAAAAQEAQQKALMQQEQMKLEMEGKRMQMQAQVDSKKATDNLMLDLTRQAAESRMGGAAQAQGKDEPGEGQSNPRGLGLQLPQAA